MLGGGREGPHQPGQGRVVGHVLHQLVHQLAGFGGVGASLGQDAAGHLLEGRGRGQAGPQLLHVVANLPGRVLDAGGEALQAGHQGLAGALQLLGQALHHGQGPRFHPLRGDEER